MIPGLLLLIVMWLLSYPASYLFDLAWDGRDQHHCRFIEIMTDLAAAITWSIIIFIMIICGCAGVGFIVEALWTM